MYPFFSLTRSMNWYIIVLIMETLTTIHIIQILRKKTISLFTLSDFGRLFNIHNKQTLYKILQRLEKKKIITQLIKGKYLFLLSSKAPHDFTIANFIYQPSYVSLESALSLYGIITSFPYTITSVTTKK